MPAAAKHTALAAATLAAFAGLVALVPAGGASRDKDRDREAPTTPANVRVLEVSPTTVSVAWDPSADNVGVEGYFVYGESGKPFNRNSRHFRDQDRAVVDEPRYTLEELKCGESTQITIVAFDAAENRSDRATATVTTAPCPDVQAPAVPSGFKQVATSANAVVLTWAPSSDDVGVVEYGVYRVLGRIATTPEPNVTLAGLSCGSTYDYFVDAADGAGNRSARASVFVRTSPCPAPSPGDSTPPSTPTNLLSGNVTDSALVLSWTKSTDNVAVTAYDLYRNGSKVASPTTTSASQSGLTCGTSYTFGVAARDAAGNVSIQALLTVATAACAPPPPPSDTTPPSTPGNLRIVGVTPSSASLAWSPSTDNVAMAGYESFVDGAWAATTVQPSATVSNLECGRTYRFEVGAFDAQGNESPRASVTGSTAACPDTQPPSAPTNLIATSRTATSIALSWAASSDNVGVAGYGLYRGGAGSGTSATTTAIFAGLACNTNYTLAVDAYDGAGNRSSKATVMIATTACPDTDPPSAPTGLAASGVTQTSLTLSWNAASDNVGVTGYDVYRGGTKVASVTSTSLNQTALACGTSYAFDVRAHDAAGNVSLASRLNVTTSACPAPPPPAGSPYFVADYANGTFGSPWTLLFSHNSPGWVNLPASQSPDGRVKVGPAPSGSGNAARFELRDSDPGWPSNPSVQKAEVRTDTLETFDKPGVAVGDVRWFSTRIYLPYNATEKFEWAHGGSQPYTALFGMHPASSTGWGAIHLGWEAWQLTAGDRNMWLNFFMQGGNFPEDTHNEVINLLPLTDGSGTRVMANHNRWIDLVWGMKFAPDNTGWLEVWVDGVNRYPRKNRPTMWAGDSGQYFKYGLYKRKDASFPETGRSVVYFGRTTIGLTKP